LGRKWNSTLLSLTVQSKIVLSETEFDTEPKSANTDIYITHESSKKSRAVKTKPLHSDVQTDMQAATKLISENENSD
jgi:hypothetical protein